MLPNTNRASDLLRRLLDNNYTRAAQVVTRAIVGNTESGVMARRLRELDAEAQRLADAGERMTADNPVVRALLADFETTMRANARLIDGASGQMQQMGIDAGREITFRLSTGLETPAQLTRLGISWNTPSVEAIARVVEYTDSGAWADMLAGYADNAVTAVQNIAVRGVALGRGPLATAREVRRAVEGIPAAQANNLMRTLQLTSYRDSAAATTAANADVLESYSIRIAVLDARTCFPKGTLITTLKNGKRPIEDVCIGDYVLTHTGSFQRVTATMKKKYRGGWIGINTKTSGVHCTEDHPILVSREGERNWISAKDCKVGDVVFVDEYHKPDQLNHLRGHVAVKGRVGYSNNGIASGCKARILSAIRFWSGMPVNTVDLKCYIAVDDVKVNGVTVNIRLLFKAFTDGLKALANVALRLGFADIPSIATRRTELLVGHCGNHTEFMSAGETGFYNGGSSAFFTAIMPLVSMHSKNLATSLTRDISCASAGAFNAAIVVPVGIRRRNGEFFAASHTGFSYTTTDMSAFRTTETGIPLTHFRQPQFKIAATNLTGKSGASTLGDAHASTATISSVDSTLGGAEFGATDGADVFIHDTIVSKTATRVQCEVYNLEVETDHSYVANGIVVHNCMACVVLHGTRIPVGQRVDDHNQGRCTSVTPIRGRTINVRSGIDWFEALSETRQRSQMHNDAMYEAWQTGAVRLSEIPRRRVDPVFGGQVIEASLAGLLGPAAAQFYSRNGRAG